MARGVTIVEDEDDFGTWSLYDAYIWNIFRIYIGLDG